MDNARSYSIYLHIPFCRHRCGYCDFNTYSGLESRIPDYGRALRREAELAAQAAGERLPVHTIFFGGGTPSLLSLNEVEATLESLSLNFSLLEGVEITLEANPGTLSLDYLRGLRSRGVNRLSLGMQSSQPDELRLLERQHDYLDVVAAVRAARQAGFDNLNLDLIFGLPYQELASWQRSVELALGLHPEHFSLYSLTLEHGTPLARWAGRGLLSEPDPDLAADMYEWASDRLEAAGYFQYEISNWAWQKEPGDESLICRHNLQYWRMLPYLGLGAGAHGFAAGMRTANVLAPAAYIQRCIDGQPGKFPRTPATQSVIAVDRAGEIADTMMMGLRLVHEGVPDERFRQRFGQGLADLFQPQIERLAGYGLLEWANTRNGRSLRLTREGRLLGNQVFVEFI